MQTVNHFFFFSGNFPHCQGLFTVCSPQTAFSSPANCGILKQKVLKGGHFDGKHLHFYRFQMGIKTPCKKATLIIVDKTLACQHKFTFFKKKIL